MSQKSRVLGALVLSAFAVTSSRAFALISAQAEVGRRSAEFGELDGDGKTKATGTELQVTAQLDPIPLVPVGFGLLLATTSLTLSDSVIDKMSGTFVVPHVSAWVPNPTDFKPFVRLGYAVYGALAGSGKSGTTEVSEAFSLTGPLLGLGVKWSFLPLISAIAEYQIFNPKLKVTKAEVGGVSIKDNVEAPTLKTTAVLLGAEVGF